jgi:PAS domain S-box-containing protein
MRQERFEGHVMQAGAGESEMRRRVREFNWAATPLGPMAGWPDSLKLAVDMVLVSGFPMAVRWGLDLICIYNDAYAGLLGEKHPYALGKPLREVWPEIWDRLGPLSEAILRREREAFFAVDHRWVIQRHGIPEEARFTVSYSPIPEASAPNGIGGLLVTVFETTERVRNEARLRLLTDELEAQVRQRTRERDRIWIVSEDLLGLSNFEGYFTSVNPAWSALLGWSEDEIKSMHVSELRHPDDAPAAVAGRARLALGVPTVRMENRFRHKDGSWRWLAWTMTADEGDIYVAGRHITSEKWAAEQLRASEEQFRLLVAGVLDYALIMLDPHGIVTSWNAGAERIKGYTAEEIIGRHFSVFYTAADREAGKPQRALAIAAETGKFEAEAERVRKDGSQFWAHVIMDAIRDDQGKLIGFAKITRDISERRESQAALERAQAQLAQSQKMEALGQLTGGVAHDFNNLLMIVSGHAQSLLPRASDPKQARALEAIQAAASRGEALTRQLLTFARRQPMNPTTVDLAAAVDAFRDVLASSVTSNIDFHIGLPHDLWPVAIDITEFELVLVNLIVNARDAMPKGGAIVLSAANVNLAGYETMESLVGEFVALTVSDTGTGIAPDVIGKVFEPFFTTKSAEKGTGLGMSQAYGFARQSGGAIKVASEPGRGTQVTTYLPRSKEPLERIAMPERVEAAPGRGERILVVEDNPEVQAVATAMLEQLDYRTYAVETAAAALAALESGARIDLVFTDVMLQGDTDGVELALAVRERYPDIPVVLTSGYAKALRAHHALPILRKPYQLAALGKAIRENIDAGRRGARPRD